MADDNPARIPVVAIHGVGNHPLGAILDLIRRNLGQSREGLDVDLSEFNWDQFVEHSSWSGYRDSYWSIQKVSSNVQDAAKLAISHSTSEWDSRLAGVQRRLCDLARFGTAITFTIILSFPLLLIVVFLPGVAWEVNEFLPEQELSWLANHVFVWLLLGVAALLFLIPVLDMVRTAISRSSSRFRAALCTAVLSALAPVLVTLSVPIVVNWMATWIFVLIFGGFLLLAFLPAWFLSILSTPVEPIIYSDLVLLPYGIAFFVLIVSLQGVHYLLRNHLGRWSRQSPAGRIPLSGRTRLPSEDHR